MLKNICKQKHLTSSSVLHHCVGGQQMKKGLLCEEGNREEELRRAPNGI